MHRGVHRKQPARAPLVVRRALVLGMVISLLTAGMAMADQVVNNIDSTIDPALETRTITAGGSTVVGFFIRATTGGGDASGCNSTGADPATVTLSVPAGVTASPTSLTFTGCGIVQNVTFSSSAVGSHTVGVGGVSGGKSGSLWDTAPAAFTLIVNAPADTTPPVITPSVAGTLGTNGWYTSDVTVSWTVTDPESAITASSGCGSTTINADTAGTPLTCSATSAGGTNSQTVTVQRDATPPTIDGSASPGPNGNGWNNTDVTVSFSCSDATSGVVSCGPDQTLSSEGAGQSASGTAVDNAGNIASAAVGGINIDKTAPSVGASASPGPNGNGWNNTDVTVSFSGSDALSGIAGCDAPVVLSSEGTGQSATGSCTDLAGNAASATKSGINIDKTAPTLAPTVSPNPVYLGGSATASPNAGDGLSGIATESCGTPETSSVGSKTVNCTATDNAGNTGSAVATYSVIYDFAGFFRPVDNLPTLNTVKAGSAIPIKFSLNGNQGLNIFAAGFPKSSGVACQGGAPVDAIEETVTAGSSSLSYDPVTDQYNYVWKTERTWTGCRQLVVLLADGMEYRANFKFTK